MPLVSTSPRRSCRRWRFTWESLAHTPTLRLFLFSSEVEPSKRCENLEASLCLGESRVVVRWREEGAGDLELRVPVPRVLIDTVAPSPGLVQEGPDQDMKHLSTGDVHFYCKTCCTRVTKIPSRKFVEMPSADWREVADNWFGTGCCSFGGISEKLVRAYIKAYSCAESTCLLDGPSVTICKDDLEGYEFTQCPVEHSSHSDMNDPVAKVKGMSSANASEGTRVSPDPTKHSLNERKADIGAERKMDANENSDIFHGSSVNQVFPNESFHCFTPMGNLASHVGQNGSLNVVLGCGFLIKICNLSNEVQWVEFSCRNCSSLLGSYPITKGLNYPVDSGIRLFKCYVSTSLDCSGPDNVFRNHTLQRLFVKSLLESATDELSYHTIVKDLSTRSPVGDCFENEISGCLSEVNLQPVVKVLFSDCSSETRIYSREVEQWLTRKHSDEVFMLTRQAKELMELLKSAHDNLPASCSSFQGMSLSYIER
ncbi:unnamed protein product [Spirodela intermedia]|uniref:Uncharacterized protein n=1 Tax=Spirodela intermedia TaxID=51605 RepID=A0A7I8JNW9_SPIIN|nr:unnamed protein product [Spirodela intermedia]CAA6671465.1 unnamed protein product [Spirodela intermedia]